MEGFSEVVIIGGGLAGLTAALHLSANGIQTVLIEKHEYPRHKVCGEYLSHEVIPYLKSLGADLQTLFPHQIETTVITTRNGVKANAKLPLGGIGLSRFALDDFLYKKAVGKGCTFWFDTVVEVDYAEDVFTVQMQSGKTVTSKVIIGGFGKRSNLDQKLERHFIKKRSPWLAVKAHYKGDFPENVVALHNFRGGYCGVSKTETGSLNVCYLADYKSFSRFKNIREYEQNVLYRNPHLKAILEHATPEFEKPLTISQIAFTRKEIVDRHILMAGDTAGLIHPLCGNGMAMAIHSAKLASEQAIRFLHGKQSRLQMEQRYTREWKKHFSKRLRMGNALSVAMRSDFLSNALMQLITAFPSFLPFIIRQTHGKPVI